MCAKSYFPIATWLQQTHEQNKTRRTLTHPFNLIPIQPSFCPDTDNVNLEMFMVTRGPLYTSKKQQDMKNNLLRPLQLWVVKTSFAEASGQLDDTHDHRWKAQLQLTHTYTCMCVCVCYVLFLTKLWGLDFHVQRTLKMWHSLKCDSKSVRSQFLSGVFFMHRLVRGFFFATWITFINAKKKYIYLI